MAHFICLVTFTEQGLSQLPVDGFDRILLDAPCSGLGVMRRNPDIKWHRSEKELVKNKTRQLRLLDNLAHAVKPDGFLVYAVCSPEPEENEEVVDHFLKKHTELLVKDVGIEAACELSGKSVRVSTGRGAGGTIFLFLVGGALWLVGMVGIFFGRLIQAAPDFRDPVLVLPDQRRLAQQADDQVVLRDGDHVLSENTAHHEDMLVQVVT